VVPIDERWEDEAEWWELEPVSKMHYQVALEDGVPTRRDTFLLPASLILAIDNHPVSSYVSEHQAPLGRICIVPVWTTTRLIKDLTTS